MKTFYLFFFFFLFFCFFFFFFLFSFLFFFFFFLGTERLFPFSTLHRQSLSLNYIVKASSLPMKAACPKLPHGFKDLPEVAPLIEKQQDFSASDLTALSTLSSLSQVEPSLKGEFPEETVLGSGTGLVY